MGSISFGVQLSENGTTKAGTPKLAFIIPADISTKIRKKFPCEQVKVTLNGVKHHFSFVINLTSHSNKKGKERLKGNIPKKWVKDAIAFKDEELQITIASI